MIGNRGRGGKEKRERKRERERERERLVAWKPTRARGGWPSRTCVKMGNEEAALLK